MDKFAVAQNYATSLFECAKSDPLGSKVGEFLALINRSIVSNRGLWSKAIGFMSKDDLRNLFADITKDKSPLINRFVDLLIDNRRLDLLDEIHYYYKILELENDGMICAEVTVAGHITKAEEQDIQSKIEELLDKKVFLALHEDKNIIGGIRVQVGSYLLDASLKSKLTKVEEIIIGTE